MPIDELLGARKDQLIATWLSEVRASLAPRTLDLIALEDTIPQFIERLRGALNGAAPVEVDLPTSAEIARAHGLQRLQLGFNLASIVREYGVLRRCIFELAEALHLGVTEDERRRVNHFIDKAAADAAEEFAHAKDEQLRQQAAQHLGFLAHELRGHLTGAGLMISMIERKGAPAGDGRMKLVQQTLRRVGELIDRALIQSRLQGLPAPRYEPVALVDLLREVIAISLPEAAEKELALGLEEEKRVVIDGDPKLLLSALSNLVRNAVKFSHPGGAITLRLRGDPERAVIEVEDCCGGLPEGKASEMFDPFVQLGGDRSGFGLGLTIARQAVEAHHGSLRVHDLPGKGCVFYVALPVTRPSSELPPAAPLLP